MNYTEPLKWKIRKRETQFKCGWSKMKRESRKIREALMKRKLRIRKNTINIYKKYTKDTNRDRNKWMTKTKTDLRNSEPNLKITSTPKFKTRKNSISRDPNFHQPMLKLWTERSNSIWTIWPIQWNLRPNFKTAFTEMEADIGF